MGIGISTHVNEKFIYNHIVKTVEDVVPYDKRMDLVYILKPQEVNSDLKYSLRSVAKFCTFRNIWLVGYKPTWTTNVNYIQTLQNKGKYKNSIINYLAACNCPDISDNFVLMNDDFFAIDTISNWEVDTNLYLGTLEDEIEHYKDKENKSKWQYAFSHAVDLLDKLNCNNHLNFETHLPIIINKQKFIEMMELSVIKEFCETSHVLHKRSIYKNLYFDNTYTKPVKIKDVKLDMDADLTQEWLTGKWLSVYDGATGNFKKFPNLNRYLSSRFSNKCRFEK